MQPPPAKIMNRTQKLKTKTNREPAITAVAVAPRRTDSTRSSRSTCNPLGSSPPHRAGAEPHRLSTIKYPQWQWNPGCSTTSRQAAQARNTTVGFCHQAPAKAAGEGRLGICHQLMPAEAWPSPVYTCTHACTCTGRQDSVFLLHSHSALVFVFVYVISVFASRCRAAAGDATAAPTAPVIPDAVHRAAALETHLGFTKNRVGGNQRHVNIHCLDETQKSDASGVSWMLAFSGSCAFWGGLKGN